MADDPWMTAGFTPAPEPKTPDVTPEAAPPSPPPGQKGPDAWAAAGFTPAPTVDYSKLDAMPGAVADKHAAGVTAVSAMNGKLDNMGPALQAIFSPKHELQSQLFNEWGEALKRNAVESGGLTQEGISDITGAHGIAGSLDILKGVAKVGMGALNAAFAPVVAGAKVAGDEATKLTGNEEFGKKVEALTMLASPFPAARPLIATAEGKMARLGLNEDGKMEAHLIGEPPAPTDFKAAADQIHSMTGETSVVVNGVERTDLHPKAAPEEIEQKLVEYWQKQGLHPAEVAEIARNNPTMAGDLSAGRTPAMPLPERPDRSYINELDDKFYSLKGNHTADQAEIFNTVKEWPTQMKDPALQEKLYRYGEGDPNIKLTPEEGELFNKYILPWRQEASEIYERIKGIGLTAEDTRVADMDPNYMHRMVMGKTPEIDHLAGEGGEANPVFNGPGLMSRSASSLNDRKFFVAEDEAGNRRVVQIYDGGLKTVSKDKTAPVDTVTSEDALHPGSVVKMGDTNFTIKQATTAEIEAATNVEYYKNAGASVANNLVRLRAAERAIDTAQQIRSTPEWEAYTGKDNPRRGDNWISPEMPLFKNDVMDPKLAHVIDDFWGNRDIDGFETVIAKINNFAVGSLFWTPFPHAFNATAWWVTARGFDNITPAGLKSMIIDGGNAIREVVTQGEKYQELMRKGTGLVYGGVANKDFYEKVLQAVGMQMKKDPSKLEELAKLTGMKSGYDLIAGLYNYSAKGLWAVSDMFTVQRVMELERKGMTTEKAIAETERYMINYRKPSEIMGQRSLAEAYFNPEMFEFSRYHWGVMSRFGQLAKDLIDVRDPRRASQALGSVMALAALQLFVWPAMTKGVQAVTGNHELSVPSFGPGRLANPVVAEIVNSHPTIFPKYIQDYYHDDKAMMTAILQLAPISPAFKGLINTLTNRDTFTGKQTVEPADVRNSSVLSPEGRKNMLNVAGQGANQAARIFVQPYDAINEMYRKKKSVSGSVMEQMFGIQETSPEDEARKEKALAFQEKAAARRPGQRQGLIEDAVRKAVGGD